MVDHERTGLLFAPGDCAALVDLLCRLAEQPGWMRSLARAGREYVLDQRSWQAITHNYVPAYEHALHARRAASQVRGHRGGLQG
jgi:glycosyltransferase involved in cell wall biosynthesis